MFHFLKPVVLLQPKSFPVHFAHISSTLEVVFQGEEILLQCLQFVVSVALVVWQNGNAICHLKTVGVGSIVHQHQLRKVSTQQPQVLYVVSLVHIIAVPPEEPVLHMLAVWIQIVYHLVGICVVAGRKDHDLEVWRQLGQKLLGPWTYIDWCQHGRPS